MLYLQLICTQIVYKWYLVDKNINWNLIHSKPQTLCALNWFWHPEQGLKTNDVVHDQVPTKTTRGRGEPGVLGGQGVGPEGGRGHCYFQFLEVMEPKPFFLRLTLFLPAVVTWHSYMGWFRPWPVGIGLSLKFNKLKC